jgi:hypothetical protein
LANTWKDTIKLLLLASNYVDIIRMEWEGVEKAGGCVVDERSSRMEIRREAENFEKRGWRKKMKKSQSPHGSKTEACVTQTLSCE